jgi:hypothetical protein
VDEDDAGHASRFSGLLHVKVSQARVFQSSLKNGGGTTRMVHVTSSRRLRRVQAEDRRIDATDCVRPFYSNFTVFYVLVSRGILVFSFLLEPINRGKHYFHASGDIKSPGGNPTVSWQLALKPPT